MSEGKYANGVYLKRSGHLAVIDHYVNDEGYIRYTLDEGKIMHHPLLRISYPIVLESSSRRFGCGPSSFLKHSEYLGEL